MRDHVYWGMVFIGLAILLVIWSIWYLDGALGMAPLLFGIFAVLLQLAGVVFWIRALRESDIEALEIRGTNAIFARAFPFYFFALHEPPLRVFLADYFFKSAPESMRAEFFLFQPVPTLFSMRPPPDRLHILSAVYQDNVNSSLYHATEIATVSQSDVEHLSNIFKDAGILSHCVKLLDEQREAGEREEARVRAARAKKHECEPHGRISTSASRTGK